MNTHTKETCWGGIDFDGDEGEPSAERAREWAFRADLVWTHSGIMKLYRHMHNGNPDSHFYHGFYANRDYSSRVLIVPKWKACWSKNASMPRKAEEARP